MSRRWRILESAVEQKIQFPSKKEYDDYLAKLKSDKRKFEVVKEQEQENSDGTYTVILRKWYNYTPFMKRDSLNLDEA